MQKNDVKRQKIAFSIGAKLIALNALLLIAAISTLMWITTQHLTRDNIALIQQNNAEAALSLANQSREIFSHIYEKTYTWGKSSLVQNENSNPDLSLESDPEYIGAVAVALNDKSYTYKSSTLNPNHRSSFSPETFINFFNSTQDFKWNPDSKSSDLRVSSFSIDGIGPTLAIAFPVGNDGLKNEIVFVGLFKQSKLINVFSKFESATSFLVDKTGTVLAHPNTEKAAKKEKMLHLPVVRRFLEAKSSNETLQYQNPQSSEGVLGAFNTTGVDGMAVIIEVPEAKAFESANNIRQKAIWLSAFILSLSFLLAYLYSETLSRPIVRLSEAAFRIARGDFKISLQVKGRDEVAHLSQTFNEMAKDLEHREKVIETFHKFHNKEIADKLLSGDVNLQGERKDAVILFTDLRDFTSLSESITAEEVVEMLNEYMTRMVSIIRAHKGIVDKFVGDAIMAVWGIPEGSPDDVRNAVKACIAMREDLQKLNEERAQRGKAPLKMGMGLNRGEVIAGNIGSTEKMEYTVIGDPVNVASRIESMTKSFQTDILISANVKESVESEFEFEACADAQVKGKTEALKLFKVTGRAHSQETENTKLAA